MKVLEVMKATGLSQSQVTRFRREGRLRAERVDSSGNPCCHDETLEPCRCNWRFKEEDVRALGYVGTVRPKQRARPLPNWTRQGRRGKGYAEWGSADWSRAYKTAVRYGEPGGPWVRGSDEAGELDGEEFTEVTPPPPPDGASDQSRKVGAVGLGDWIGLGLASAVVGGGLLWWAWISVKGFLQRRREEARRSQAPAAPVLVAPGLWQCPECGGHLRLMFGRWEVLGGGAIRKAAECSQCRPLMQAW